MSPAGPSSATRPASMRMARSQEVATILGSWLTSMTVCPRARNSAIALETALPKARVTDREDFVEHQDVANRRERDGVAES